MQATDTNQDLKQTAKSELKAISSGQVTSAESASLVMDFIKNEEKNILERHRSGAGGLEITSARAALLDAVLEVMFEAALKRQKGAAPEVALVAQGGYGRGQLNPGSDLDLLFLLAPRIA